MWAAVQKASRQRETGEQGFGASKSGDVFHSLEPVPKGHCHPPLPSTLSQIFAIWALPLALTCPHSSCGSSAWVSLGRLTLPEFSVICLSQAQPWPLLSVTQCPSTAGAWQASHVSPTQNLAAQRQWGEKALAARAAQRCSCSLPVPCTEGASWRSGASLLAKGAGPASCLLGPHGPRADPWSGLGPLLFLCGPRLRAQ